MSYLDKTKEIYKMLQEGQMMEAFEKYYHEDVVMQETGEEERVGKEANREYEKKWLANVKEMHGTGVAAFASDEPNGITMVESWMDVTFQDGNRVKMEQVAVQQWKGNQIIHEKFYHK